MEKDDVEKMLKKYRFKRFVFVVTEEPIEEGEISPHYLACWCVYEEAKHLRSIAETTYQNIAEAQRTITGREFRQTRRNLMIIESFWNWLIRMFSPGLISIPFFNFLRREYIKEHKKQNEYKK
jgi:hypothetical protein